jgi:hypothetical protein
MSALLTTLCKKGLEAKPPETESRVAVPEVTETETRGLNWRQELAGEAGRAIGLLFMMATAKVLEQLLYQQ